MQKVDLDTKSLIQSQFKKSPILKLQKELINSHIKIHATSFYAEVTNKNLPRFLRSLQFAYLA